MNYNEQTGYVTHNELYNLVRQKVRKTKYSVEREHYYDLVCQYV